jgi:diguanylate cyclase (GGDEF)-like protein
MRPSVAPFEQRGIELLRLLVDQLGVAVQNARDYRERAEQAVRDPLTGLYNRRHLLEALDKEVARIARYRGEATLVVFDLDDFKLVNERHGHAAGDDVLRALASRANLLVRPADTLARIGGEEFALLLPQTSQLEGLLVAERLRAAIARDPLLGERRITISAGIASCPSDATTGSELQIRADAALYWAKRNGKDICAVAGEAVEEAIDVDADNLVAHLYGLVAMIDARLQTRAHAENVAAYAVAIGELIGFERDRSVRLRRAAMLHDVGKVAVDAAVLTKAGGLTEEEFAQIREHSVTGGVMLVHAGLHEEAKWVRHHHERVDGGGYPDGLEDDQIPLESRILFVADAFEAMTSDRPYRAGMPVADALAELARCATTQFDPAIVQAMIELVESGRLPSLALRGPA